MTFLELRDELKLRLSRSDAATVTLINTWINRVIKDICRVCPFSFLKHSQQRTLTANENTFILPDDSASGRELILHHPFMFLLQGLTSDDPQFKPLVKINDRFFDITFTNPTETTGEQDLYVLRGGTGGNEFDIYPVETQDRTLRIMGGYYYFTVLSLDADENYLTEHYSDLVMEGVAYKAFKHFREYDKSQQAYSEYLARLNGDAKIGISGIIQDDKKKQRANRVQRLKDLEDLPLVLARKIHLLGA